jgi:hypothetical protein
MGTVRNQEDLLGNGVLIHSDGAVVRLLRVLGRALVVVLLAAAVTTASSACLEADRGLVPPELVGVWRGGNHSNGSWCYEFSTDGTYRAWPERAPGAMNTGTIVVDHTTIWFSNGGAPVRSAWSLSQDVLLLDGQRYERA